MAQRFRAAGFPAADVVVLGPNDRKKNLVVRLHGSGQHQPVLLIGHLDVVEARREDWSTDPFKLVEKDGYFYGRGSLDMKSGDAIMASDAAAHEAARATARAATSSSRSPRTRRAAAATAWSGCSRNHRELIDAEFVLNHDGLVGYSITSEHGVPQEFALSATEKMYADYQLTVTNRGGHSSLPRPDNAIYELAQGLLSIGGYSFPLRAQRGDARLFRSAWPRPAAGRRPPTCAPSRSRRPTRRRSRDCRASRSSTRCCAPPAWRPA